MSVHFASGSLAALMLISGLVPDATSTSATDPEHIGVRRSSSARRVHVAGEDHVAILITGQAYRFTYKDQFDNVEGGLTGFVCGAGNKACNTKADIYIVLAETQGIWPHCGTMEPGPQGLPKRI